MESSHSQCYLARDLCCVGTTSHLNIDRNCAEREWKREAQCLLTRDEKGTVVTLSLCVCARGRVERIWSQPLRSREAGDQGLLHSVSGAVGLSPSFDLLIQCEIELDQSSGKLKRSRKAYASRSVPRGLGAATAGDGVRNRRFTLQMAAQVHACSRKVRGRNLPSSLNWT